MVNTVNVMEGSEQFIKKYTFRFVELIIKTNMFKTAML